MYPTFMLTVILSALEQQINHQLSYRILKEKLLFR
jgi:hypothetical protein